jgi:hypothetical protein
VARRRQARTKGGQPRPLAASADEILAFPWPPFIAQEDGEFLAQRVQEGARDERERASFLQVLARAYQDVVELETLYAELPGVLADDRGARESFVGLLDAAPRSPPPDLDIRAFEALALGPLPKEPGGLPCEPHFLIKPSVVYAIMQGVERVTDGDPSLRETYARAVRGLWDRAAPLEHIYGQARLDSPGTRLGRLAKTMRVIARDTNAGLPPEGGSVAVRTSPTGGWPPPASDPLPHWPPPIGGHGRPDLCGLVKDVCRQLVFGGVREFKVVPTPTYVDGISSISPTAACAGDRVTLNGSFSTAQPAGVKVLIGTTPATVVSWSSTAIMIEVPPAASSGCVGFVNTALAGQALQAAQDNQTAFDSLSHGLGCLGAGGKVGPHAPIPAPAAPCAGFNFLTIGPPVIEYFTIAPAASVTPNTTLVASWKVNGAANVEIRRTSGAGPGSASIFQPPTGTLTLGIFAGTKTAVATYELIALNQCGKVTRSVSVSLDQPPVLAVTAIEVVQTIQRANNSVRLVAGKRTLVRVFVGSGITNGFDKGAGPNVQPSVTGDVVLVGPGGVTGAVPPLNPGGVLAAQPAGYWPLNRANAAHSLNFEPPLSVLSGKVTITARVWVTGHENDAGGPWRASRSTSVIFLSQPTQELLPILINDMQRALPAPSLTQFNFSLQGARTRYPIAQSGFLVNPPLGDTTQPYEDLGSPIGWGLLLARIGTMIFIFPSTPVGGIRCGLVPPEPTPPPATPTYALGGLAPGLPSVPSLLAQAAPPPFTSFLAPFAQATFAHELAHNLGLEHAPCPSGYGAPGNIDPRLPGWSDDVGADVPLRAVIATGASELMSYCDEPRWPSIATYDILFDSLPI